MSLTLLSDHFADIEDPRQASKVTYELFDVLFLTLTVVISGAEGWEEIEDFGHLRLEWLKNSRIKKSLLLMVRRYVARTSATTGNPHCT